jgi:hypothetical protein
MQSERGSRGGVAIRVSLGGSAERRRALPDPQPLDLRRAGRRGLGNLCCGPCAPGPLDRCSGWPLDGPLEHCPLEHCPLDHGPLDDRRRIVPAGVERVALTQPDHRKQGATRRPMALDARIGVPRARRVKPALSPEERRQKQLIEPDEPEKQPGNHGPAQCAASNPPSPGAPTTSPDNLTAPHQRCRSLHHQSPHRCPLGPDLGQPQLGRPGSHDHHQIDALGQQPRVEPERLSHKPLGPVPRHRVPHLLRRRDPQPTGPRGARRPAPQQQHEMGRRHPNAAVLHGEKISTAADPLLSRQPEPRAHASLLDSPAHLAAPRPGREKPVTAGNTLRPTSRGVIVVARAALRPPARGRNNPGGAAPVAGFAPTPLAARRGGDRDHSLLVRADRQAVTTLAAAVGDDLAAARGRHAGAKPVGPETADVVRLERALHVRGLYSKKGPDFKHTVPSPSSASSASRPPLTLALSALEASG